MKLALGFCSADDFDSFTSAFQMHGEAPNAILTVRVQHDLFD